MYSLAELGIVNYIIGIWFSNQKMTSMAYKIYHFMGHRKHVKSYIYIETFLFSQKVFKLTHKKNILTKKPCVSAKSDFIN